MPLHMNRLKAPAIEVFADVHVASAVRGQRVRNVQRSAGNTLLSDVINDLQRLTQQNPWLWTRGVPCQKQEAQELLGRANEWSRIAI